MTISVIDFAHLILENDWPRSINAKVQPEDILRSPYDEMWVELFRRWALLALLQHSGEGPFEPSKKAARQRNRQRHKKRGLFPEPMWKQIHPTLLAMSRVAQQVVRTSQYSQRARNKTLLSILVNSVSGLGLKRVRFSRTLQIEGLLGTCGPKQLAYRLNEGRKYLRKLGHALVVVEFPSKGACEVQTFPFRDASTFIRFHKLKASLNGSGSLVMAGTGGIIDPMMISVDQRLNSHFHLSHNQVRGIANDSGQLSQSAISVTMTSGALYKWIANNLNN